MKWWHIALIGIGGYFIYKMLKPAVALAVSPSATSDIEGLRQALEGKLQAVGSQTKSVKAAVEGDQLTFRDAANNNIVFAAATKLTPDEIASQIDAI